MRKAILSSYNATPSNIIKPDYTSESEMSDHLEYLLIVNRLILLFP